MCAARARSRDAPPRSCWAGSCRRTRPFAVAPSCPPFLGPRGRRRRPPREQRRPQHGKVEEDLFVEEVKEDPGEEYDDFPLPDEEEPEPARKTMTMTIV